MYREFVKFLSLCLYILLLDSKFISLMYIMLKLDILFQVHIEAKKVFYKHDYMCRHNGAPLMASYNYSILIKVI